MKTSFATKIGRESMTDRVVQEVRRRIVSGLFPEGTNLRQEWLAAQLGVSRIPVREAIRQLEAEGLVTSETHRGTVVSSLSPLEIEELFEIRVQLETWLFSLAIPRLREADLALAAALTQQAATEGTAENWGELNWRFHKALYAPAGRTQALRLLRGVHHNANRYVNLHIAVSADIPKELEDHRELVALAGRGDVGGGVAMLRTHIDRVSHALLSAVGEHAAKASA
jgi:DNA-binding GntR family transcriptional regulator